MRINFEFRPSEGCPPLEWRKLIPEGFEVRRIDSEIASRLQANLITAGVGPWFDQVWGNISEFLNGGFGFIAECEVEGAPFLASNCRSWSVQGGVASIQVSTRAAFRGQGLAVLVCSAFIEHCLEHGLTPEYSCEEENSASAALALKLGFVPVGKREA